MDEPATGRCGSAPAVGRRSLGFILALAVIGIGEPAPGQDGGVVADAGPPLEDLVSDAMRQLARKRNAAGLRLTEARRYPEALTAFREAHDLDPNDAEITNNLGFLHQLLGNRRDAERYLRQTLRLSPRRATAINNLAGLLAESADRGRQAEAAELLGQLRLIEGNTPEILRRQARLAAQRGRELEALAFYDALLARVPADDALALELGDFHREAGRIEAALTWYRRVQSPDGELSEAARRIRALEIDREARRYGWVRAGGEPPAAVKSQVERARTRLATGRARDARTLLDAVVERAPGYIEAYVLLGDACQAADDAACAELSWLRALVMDATHAEAARRLGMLYVAQARPADGAMFLERALILQPEWFELHLEVARAWQAAGDLPRALRQVQLARAALPEDFPDDDLRALEAALTAELPTQPATDPAAGKAPDPVARAVARARAHLAAEAPGEAMAELEALDPADRGAPVLNLQGEIMTRVGRVTDAADVFAASLALDRDQPEIAARLGLIRLEQGQEDDGRRLLDEAARSGNPRAALALARLDLPPSGAGWWSDAPRVDELLASRSQLSGILANPAMGRVAPGAEMLLVRVDARLESLAIAAGALGLTMLVVLFALARRRWGGETLAQLLDSHPEAGPDVQRILSAIRHEVLKHNTMVIGGLVEALRRGDDAVSQAAWARASLLGPPDDPGAEAAIHRLRGYVEQLQQTGRSYGVRLNLRRRDPAVSALLAGFRTLEQLAPDLDRVVTTGHAPRSLCRQIESAGARLNTEANDAIEALLDRLRVLEIDAAALEAIFDRTRREPSFADAVVAPLHLEVDDLELPARIVVPRSAFEDVLANLFRNAMQSTIRHAPGETVVVGLGLSEEVDFITGLARVMLQVRDRSPQPLTTEMLRGRYIEAGLGLTADLVSRHDGSLDIAELESPWCKAVVLSLPLAEDDEEFEWTD